MDLPTFKYHPDPIATGAFERSDSECVCCGKARGYIYVGPVFSEYDIDDSLCPWCIADGSAAQKFEALFVDDYGGPGRQEPEQGIIEELGKRTPSYTGYHEPKWLTHCGDACAYLGEAESEDLVDLSSAVDQWFTDTYNLDEDTWAEIQDTYEPGDDPALYKFQCLKCGAVLLHLEWS